MPPIAAQPWAGVRDAFDYGPSAPQNPSSMRGAVDPRSGFAAYGDAEHQMAAILAFHRFARHPVIFTRDQPQKLIVVAMNHWIREFQEGQHRQRWVDPTKVHPETRFSQG
jgi:hypothetical protein